MTCKLIILAGVILYGLSLSADDLGVEPQLTPQETQAAAQVRSVLSHYLLTLDRNLVTFHYQERSKAAPDPTTTDQVVRSTAYAKRFFDATVYDRLPADAPLVNPGPGYYAGKDANVSRSFGEEHPQLYVVTLKPGTHLINGNAPAAEADTKTLTEVFARLRCSNINTNNSRVSTWVSNFRNNAGESCRKVMIKAYADLGIQATTYKWWNGTSLKDCQEGDEALAIISPTAIDPDQVAYFSDDKAIDPHGMGGFVNKLFDEKSPPKVESSMFPSSKPRALEQFRASDEAYAKWKKLNILKCGPTHFSNGPQDQPAGDTSSAISR